MPDTENLLHSLPPMLSGEKLKEALMILPNMMK